MSRRRDNFTARSIEILAKRSGQQCSHPACRRVTSGPHSDELRAVNLGVAAHITAAAHGGPRYDPDLTAEQRVSIENAIWLCQLCAKLIDSDPRYFTVELLHNWKRQHESSVAAAASGNREPSYPSMFRNGYPRLLQEMHKRDSFEADLVMGRPYLPDVELPEQSDAVQFAKTLTYAASDDDPNAELWCGTVTTLGDNSVVGAWHGRWNKSAAVPPDANWRRGTAICSHERNWLHIEFDDGISPYIIIAHPKAGKYVGRYVNCRVEDDCLPWVGFVVGNARIDGYWPLGRWDFRR